MPVVDCLMLLPAACSAGLLCRPAARASLPPTPSRPPTLCCSDEAIAVMGHPPMRGFDPELAQEPHVYRMLEVSVPHVRQL